MEHDGWASGGGLSRQFPVPHWQRKALASDVDQRQAEKGRGVPDVAGLAQASYRIRVPGGYVEAPAGRAVAPLWAGLIAQLNQRLGRDSAGYLNPSSTRASQAPTGFNSIGDGNQRRLPRPQRLGRLHGPRHPDRNELLARSRRNLGHEVCSACSGENPDGFRHCGYCGASLAAPEPERRKLRRDDGLLRHRRVDGARRAGRRGGGAELLRSYFHEMRAALQRHGGKVEKFIGDAVVAAFGVPRRMRTTHCAPAAPRSRCGRVSRARSGSSGGSGHAVAVRIGVNTGEVVTGGVQSDETFVTGDAVNIAARLEQGAAPGEVLLGETTWRLVRDAVRAEPVGPLTAKGKSEPLRAYRLLEVREAGSLPRRTGAPFTGVPTSSRCSNASSRPLRPNGAAGMVTVLGEPGVGKSRLAAEFVARGIGKARVVRGRCLSLRRGDHRTGRSRRSCGSWPGSVKDHSTRRGAALIDAPRERMSSGPVVAARLAQMSAWPKRGDARRDGLGDPQVLARSTRPACRSWCGRRRPVGGADAARPADRPAGGDHRRLRCSSCASRAPSCSSTAPTGKSACGRSRSVKRTWTRSSTPGARPRAYACASAGLAPGNPLFAEELVAMLRERASCSTDRRSVCRA